MNVIASFYWLARAVPAILFLYTQVVLAEPGPLPALGAEQKVTVSGLSSGGYAAAQFAVIYSNDVNGLGVVAGGSYLCSQGRIDIATSSCSCSEGYFCNPQQATSLAYQAKVASKSKAALDLIDPVANLKNQRVWLYWGSKDRTVPRSNVDAIARFYLDEMKAPAAQVSLPSRISAGHGMPSPAASNAVACSLSEYPYINRCQEDAAHDLLSWLYPGEVPPTPGEPKKLREFDQRPYTSSEGVTGLGDVGYVYIPTSCKNQSEPCHVHVAFHGCQQSRESSDGQGGIAGDMFATQSGYNRWAEVSRVIVLYPQVRPNLAINPKACWDFWGYTQLLPSTGVFATRYGGQMSAVRKMVAALQE